MRTRERYLLAFCFAAGFALTAGISLWRTRDSGETPDRAPPPVRTAVPAPRSFPIQQPVVPLPGAARLPPGSAPPAPSRADAQPLTDNTPAAASPQDLTVDSPERLDAAARRFARRGASERGSH